MARNRRIANAYRLSVICTNPATPASGDPVRWGLATGVALTDESAGGNPSGYTSVDFGPASWDLSVKGVNDGGNSAVAVGDAIFYVDADTPKLSKKASGYFFGFARATVGSGSTGTIEVVHHPAPGFGTLSAGDIGTTELADAGVTVEKLGANLQIGYIPLPLTSWRLIATNDIAAAGTPDGGLISLDTDPTLKRINGATDKGVRIAWAATSVVEITSGPFAYPPDLDDAAAVEVHLLMKMAAGGMDTPLVAVSYWEGVGDANAGGNTTALSTTLADKVVTIAAGNVGAFPNCATVGLIPAAHANEAMELYAAWIQYLRKS